MAYLTSFFRLSHLMCLLFILILQGCSSLPKATPLPQSLEDQVEVPGFKDIRAWGDRRSSTLYKSAKESIKQEMAANQGRIQPEVASLALSGGGEEGAFGAGLICGWTKTGNRPQFKLVTGISTGALMAPFVFLGPHYDHVLRYIYTQTSDKDIYKPYSIITVLLSFAHITSVPSLADNKPLANLITKFVDSTLLHAIAREHLKGRRLLIGTAEAYSERLVIWDMGAIAASHSPNALALFRQILLASSAIPATFPPQMIKVTAANKQYIEMHYDGGVETQVMLFENAIVPFSTQGKLLNNQRKKRKLYIIRNERVDPKWNNVKPELKYIAIRAIDSLIKSQGIGDLYRLYTYAERDHIEYNLAYVPATFREQSTGIFDKAYMNKLFHLGFQLGQSGYQWNHYPFGFNPHPQRE